MEPDAAGVRVSDASSSDDQQGELAREIKAEARRLGFGLVGIAPAVSAAGFGDFQKWLAQGFAGEMQYLSGRESAYEHPHSVLESVRSVIMLGMNYRTEERPEPGVNQGAVARYAWGTADYHDVLRARLKQLADVLHARVPGCRTRGVVDTAPLLERDFARLAGLGWFGKNTVLINKRMGSWLFLAALLTDVELSADQPFETSHCGTCTRCLDVCPTNAFVAPYVLDARRCISYLTIELKGSISRELREGMGEWLFGCDLCQDVCPWNRKAPRSHESAFQPLANLAPAEAVEILRLNDEQFRARFRESPLSRPGRVGLARNAAIVLGNRGDARAVPALIEALGDASEIVREAAAWALGKLGGEAAVRALQSRRGVEDNAGVLEEIGKALAG